MKFFDLVTSSNIVAYWINKDLNDPTVGDQLFPFKKELGVELDWIKGANNQVVGLKLSAYDAKAIRRDRQGIEKYKTEMPFFKESMVVDEKMRQQLNTLLQTQNEALIRQIVARIFDDEIKLIKAAYETVERLRMQMLTTGTITVSGNGQSYEYDYGMPEANKITVTKSWADADADVIKDITDTQYAASRNGFKLTRAMCNTNCLNAIINNTAIKNRLYVLAQGNITITNKEVRRYIEQETGITIYVNDNGYVAEDGTFTKYFADDVFVLMPDGALGETHYGTTPEESDLMTGATKAEVSLVNNSVAVTTVKEEDPVNVMTKVSMVMLPSFEMANAVYVLDTNASSL
jgi:hypothetical protein